jgi:hypothetical protein
VAVPLVPKGYAVATINYRPAFPPQDSSHALNFTALAISFAVKPGD